MPLVSPLMPVPWLYVRVDNTINKIKSAGADDVTYSVSDHGRFKSVCCVPYFLIALLVLACLVAALILMALFGFHPFGSTSRSPPGDYTVVNSVLISLGCVVGVVALANVYTWLRAIVCLAVPTRKQVCIARVFSHPHPTPVYLTSPLPRAGSGVVRMDPLRS